MLASSALAAHPPLVFLRTKKLSAPQKTVHLQTAISPLRVGDRSLLVIFRQEDAVVIDDCRRGIAKGSHYQAGRSIDTTGSSSSSFASSLRAHVSLQCTDAVLEAVYVERDADAEILKVVYGEVGNLFQAVDTALLELIAVIPQSLQLQPRLYRMHLPFSDGATQARRSELDVRSGSLSREAG